MLRESQCESGPLTYEPGRATVGGELEGAVAMADITDVRPADVTAEIGVLHPALDQSIPAKAAGNLVIGTWNIRAFDRMTPAWRSLAGDSPIRDLSNVVCIAEIVRRFDVIAIQEVRQSAKGFLAMLQVLGPGWAYLVTDVTQGKAGNNERLAFVFDTARVHPAGLACELVVAADVAGVPQDALNGQFARTPYAVTFARGSAQFTLVTLHVVYGHAAVDRIQELTEVAQWLARWAHQRDAWGSNLIALGDFNIDRNGDPLYQAFTSTGLRPPDPLNFVPRTVFDDPNPAAPADHRHFYDQIAWFTGAGNAPVLTMGYANAGMFNFDNQTIPANSTEQLSWRISDHYPLWCEFNIGP
jgi:endonuclease/exonuclease/phosphatase family metal-dependent hydrolase